MKQHVLDKLYREVSRGSVSFTFCILCVVTAGILLTNCGALGSGPPEPRIRSVSCDSGEWTAHVAEHPYMTSVQLSYGPDEYAPGSGATLIYNIRAIDAVSVEWESCDSLVIHLKKHVESDAVRLQTVKLFDVNIRYMNNADGQI
jgi:hypothetical protein